MSIGPTETLVMVRSGSSRTAGGAAGGDVSGVRYMARSPKRYIQAGRVGSGPRGDDGQAGAVGAAGQPGRERARRAGRRRGAGRSPTVERVAGVESGRSTSGGVVAAGEAADHLVQQPVAERLGPVGRARSRRARSTWCTSTSRSRRQTTCAAACGRPGTSRIVRPRRRPASRRPRPRTGPRAARRSANCAASGRRPRPRCRRRAAPGWRTAGSPRRSGPGQQVAQAVGVAGDMGEHVPAGPAGQRDGAATAASSSVGRRARAAAPSPGRPPP